MSERQTYDFNIVSFLLLRLSEDEALAEAAIVRQWMDADFLRRVVADCASKRKIIAEHQVFEYEGASYCRVCVSGGGFPVDLHADLLGVQFPCRTLRYLAEPFASHPDFDDAWSVDL